MLLISVTIANKCHSRTSRHHRRVSRYGCHILLGLQNSCSREVAMVYISSWQDFQEAAESLYEKSPNHVCLPVSSSYSIFTWDMQTRYCVKWRGSEGKLVLKITDDTTVCTTSWSNALISQLFKVHKIQDVLLCVLESIRGSQSVSDAEDAKPTSRTARCVIHRWCSNSRARKRYSDALGIYGRSIWRRYEEEEAQEEEIDTWRADWH